MNKLQRKDGLFRGNFGQPQLELKEVAESGAFEGYAAIFDVEDRGNDTIAQGAFADSLRMIPAEKIKVLWQHDTSEVIGYLSEAFEDARGLYVKGQLITEIQKGRECQILLQKKAIEGMSIGYRTTSVKRDENSDEWKRTILTAELWEVSIVTFPMNVLLCILIRCLRRSTIQTLLVINRSS